ncbi:putative oxidoreductase [Naumannella cuiyingiana]|uniref:Putative oxidoreductase n=1 Tax=Naumannella cuiyingiana TaxID=1347891 RepID=A0A7Z0D9U1_9ACTN|nr:putative oxidoreductase [Naumannella cuiyingiana]
MATRSDDANDRSDSGDERAPEEPSRSGSSAMRRSSHADDNQAKPASQAPGPAAADEQATELVDPPGKDRSGHAKDTTSGAKDTTAGAKDTTADAKDATADDRTDESTETRPAGSAQDGEATEVTSNDPADGERTELLTERRPDDRKPLYRDEAGRDADSEPTETMAVFRDRESEGTQVMPLAAGTAAGETDWEERRRARDEALGKRTPPPVVVGDEAVAPAAGAGRSARTTDRFLASLGLFLLRLVVAAIMGLHGVAKLMAITDVQTMLAGTVIPYPEIMALVLAISEVLIALSLLFGLLVRLSGLGVALIGIGALVFVKWTTFPFSNGYELAGELELLLGAVGILFLCVGGGRWGIDGGFRARRRRAKENAADER